MKSTVMSPAQMIRDDSIGFSDSEGMIGDKFDMNVIGAIEFDELFATMNSPETKQRVLDWKLEECAPEFIESIQKIGIKTPVAILDGNIMNGHHRIAVALFLGIDIPVDIYDSWEEFDSLHQWSSPNLVDCDGMKGD